MSYGLSKAITDHHSASPHGCFTARLRKTMSGACLSYSQLVGRSEVLPRRCQFLLRELEIFLDVCGCNPVMGSPGPFGVVLTPCNSNKGITEI